MSKREMASWPALSATPANDGGLTGTWSNRVDETARLSSQPPGWPGQDAAVPGGWQGENAGARGGPDDATSGRSPRRGLKRFLALTAGVLAALAGPPFGFYLTRAALASHDPVGQGAGGLL